MAEFSRIRVTPAEEEDIVIMAGAVPDQPAPDVPDDALSVEAEGVEAGAFAKETDVPEEGPSAASGARAEAYRETTLADLQRTRMSGMQKGIVALAIAGVAAFIIWYVLLH